MPKLKAHAKINLSLRVIAQRPDGYHTIESVMQSVSLFDIITLSLIPSGIEVTCDDHRVPQGEKNLAYKAAALFDRGVKIHIEKRIPLAAGLAGGSADAAAVLLGMNAECPSFAKASEGELVPGAELMNLASGIGSDVPFCLTGGTCLVKGRGEIVEQQKPRPKTYFVLVCPDLEVSSKWAYDQHDKILNSKTGILNNSQIPMSRFKNDLERVVAAKYDIINKITGKLLKLGCTAAQMSGSGPSVFGFVKDQRQGEAILRNIKCDYPRSFVVETVERGIEEIQ